MSENVKLKFRNRLKKINSPAIIKNIVLISTPWPLFNRPSIQLGSLKAYLRSLLPDLNVQTEHLYLKVAESLGYRLYQIISERTWLAEAIYAVLLFPDRYREIEKIYQRESEGKPEIKGFGFKNLTNRIREISEELIDTIDWSVFELAGFSICLCQLTSTIYFIKQIKRRFPKLKTVVGGSLLSGYTNPKMFHIFPEIDFLINGEGEIPLGELIRHLGTPQNMSMLPQLEGVASRQKPMQGRNQLFCQADSLNNIPSPDYDDYFHLLDTFRPENRFFPTLPVETSRGCWWHRQTGIKKLKGCAFCNLNLQWEGYRTKQLNRIVSEIDHLTTKHKTLSVAFMDNMIPVKGSDKVFQQLGMLKKDFQFFGEIRASTPRRVLKKMKVAGMDEVQIGIEALCTDLLNKMNKGTTAIQNLEIMKNCEEFGIVSASNLIVHFPGSDCEDVEETLRCLDFALPFRPLRLVRFWLGLGSTVWHDPKAFGIREIFNHPNYSRLFPDEVCKSLTFMIQAYRGDLKYQKKNWRPVKEKVRVWKKTYTELNKDPLSEPILSFRDGRDFLIIRHRRLKSKPFTHRLVGTSRSIYLFCQQHRSLKRIVDHFQAIPAERIEAFLKLMIDKKLMFSEGKKYLSLAIPARYP